MKKILLTGYAPPLGCSFDATKECAEEYHRKGSHIGVQIIGAVLPCRAIDAFRVVERIVRKSKPDVIINMATMNIAKAICIETVFKNRQNDGSVIWGASDNSNFLSPKSDSKKLFDVLVKNNIPVQISTENPIAIHNELAYLVTKMVNENPALSNVKNLFVHVPLVWDYESKLMNESGEFYLKKKDYHRAMEIICKSI